MADSHRTFKDALTSLTSGDRAKLDSLRSERLKSCSDARTHDPPGILPKQGGRDLWTSIMIGTSAGTRNPLRDILPRARTAPPRTTIRIAAFSPDGTTLGADGRHCGNVVVDPSGTGCILVEHSKPGRTLETSLEPPAGLFAATTAGPWPARSGVRIRDVGRRSPPLRAGRTRANLGLREAFARILPPMCRRPTEIAALGRRPRARDGPGVG